MPKCKNIPVLISLYKFAVRTGYPRQTRFLPQWTDNVKNIPKNNEKLSSKNKLTSYEILKKKKTWGTGSCRTFSYGSDGQSYKTLNWKIILCHVLLIFNSAVETGVRKNTYIITHDTFLKVRTRYLVASRSSKWKCYSIERILKRYSSFF